MIAFKYATALAMVAAMAFTADANPLQSGVCYSPWHHPGHITEEIIQKDFEVVKQHFTSIRTFHSKFSGVNVIDSCAKAGIKVAVGIMMKDKGQTEQEIQAACEGAKRHPGAVDAIYVGNENVQNGYWGSMSAHELLGHINRVKECTAGTSIKVGTVQRINEWLEAPGIQELASACDVMGVNIYPFFTPGPQTPFEKFMIQWKQVNEKFPGGKMRVTETGWPRHGSPSPQGQVPSKETSQQYFNEYSQWAEQHPESYYFMMFDTTNAYGGGDFETSFGLFDKHAKQEIQIPAGGGSYSAPTPQPSENPYGPAPTTEAPAPTTEAPAPTTQAPAPQPEPANPYTPPPSSEHPKPAPTTESPKPSSAAPTPAPTHPETSPAPTSNKPSHAPETPCPTANKPSHAPEPAPTPATTVPHATPAATKPHHHNSTKQMEMGGEAHKHKNC